MMNFSTENRTGASERQVFSAPGRVPASGQRTGSQQAVRLDLVRSVRMHTRLAVCVAAVVFVLVVAYAATRPAVYKAESLIYVEPLSTKVLSDGTSGTYDPSRYDSYLQQQLQTVQRKDILSAAIAQLPQGTWRFPNETDDSAVTRLQNQLKVERIQNSYQLQVSLSGSDPAATAAVVNAVVKAYLDQGRREDHARADQKQQLLIEERQRIQTELAQDKAEQATLSASLGVANPAGEMGNQYDMQLAGVRSQLAAAREAHDVAAAQLSSVTAAGGLKTAGLVASADELIANDAGLSSMKATISQRRAVISSQMAGLTPSNPVYKQDVEEIAGLDRTLEKMTSQLREAAERRLQDKLRLDLQRTGDVEARLNSQLARQTATATGAAPKLQRATELQADMQRLAARYASVDDAIRGLELETGGPGPAHLSLAAQVPSTPEPGKRKLLFLLALPLALLAGGLAAVFARKRDPHVYTGHDLEEALGFQPMGVVPARHEVSGAVMDDFTLRLAAGLQSAYRSSKARSFVFTATSSVIDVHGCVFAVKEKLEQLGFTASVIDAALLLRPLALQAGEPVQPVGRDGFAAAHLDHLEEQNDLVLIDAPALLHSAATEYAARCADATILIAEAGVTTRLELNQSAALLHRLHVPGVAAVLQELHTRYAGSSFKARIEEIDRQQDRPAATRVRTRREPVEDDADTIVENHASAPAAIFLESVPLNAEMKRPAPAPVTAPSNLFMPEEDMAPGFLPVRRKVTAGEPVKKSVAPVELHAAASAPAIETKLERATMVQDDVEAAPRPSWLQRIFVRDHQPVTSIIPRDDDEGQWSPVVPPVAQTPVVAKVSAQAEMDAAPIAEALAPTVVMPAPVVETVAPIEAVPEAPTPAPMLTHPEPIRFVETPVAMAHRQQQPDAIHASEPAPAPTEIPGRLMFAEKDQPEQAATAIVADALPVASALQETAIVPETPDAVVSAVRVPPSVAEEATPEPVRPVPVSRRVLAPVALTSIPSVASSIVRPQPMRPEAVPAPLQMPSVESRERMGLARAVAHHGPARASEGLEATKQASAERRASRVTEATRVQFAAEPERPASSKPAAYEESTSQVTAPLTRRWGMLSRFAQEEQAPEYAATGTLGDR